MRAIKGGKKLNKNFQSISSCQFAMKRQNKKGTIKLVPRKKKYQTKRKSGLVSWEKKRYREGGLLRSISLLSILPHLWNKPQEGKWEGVIICLTISRMYVCVCWRARAKLHESHSTSLGMRPIIRLKRKLIKYLFIWSLIKYFNNHPRGNKNIIANGFLCVRHDTIQSKTKM